VLISIGKVSSIWKLLLELRTGYYTTCASSMSCLPEYVCTDNVCVCPARYAYSNTQRMCGMLYHPIELFLIFLDIFFYKLCAAMILHIGMTIVAINY